MPRILRSRGFGEYRPTEIAAGLRAEETHHRHIASEAQILPAFAQHANASGLFVPGSEFGKSHGIQAGDIKAWMPDGRFELAALAQYYGAPTPLLDWTRSPRVAAYFAASDAARRRPSGQPDGQLAVFGLYTRYFPSMFGGGVVAAGVARHPNANLHPQCRRPLPELRPQP